MHPPRNPRRRLSPARLTVTLALGIGAVLALQAPRPRALAAPAQAPHSGHSVASMSEAEMQRQVAEWYARHPLRGERSADVPSDSFLVNNFYFDENHDGSVTQVDTARIVRGQTILWRWQAGTHTVTNGTGAADPTAGLMFDQLKQDQTIGFSYTESNGRRTAGFQVWDRADTDAAVSTWYGWIAKTTPAATARTRSRVYRRTARTTSAVARAM